MSERSDDAWSGRAIRRSTMPVRSRIHSSEVSTMRSKSALVSTRSGTYMPVPTMVAPRIASGRRIMIRLDLLPDVLVDPLFDEADHGTDRAPVRAHPAAPVADEVDVARGTQLGQRFEHQRVALGIFLADRQQPDARIRTPEQVARVDRTHVGELDQIGGLALRVGADV